MATTTSTTPGTQRNYSNQDYNQPGYNQGSNSQYRGTSNAGNYRDSDVDARHHGRWTASGSSADLASGDYNSRYGNNRGSGSFMNRNRDQGDYNDRDYDDRNYDRSRDYSSSRIPVPPPMPPPGYMSGYDSAYSHPGGYHTMGFPYESSFGQSYPHYGSGFGSSFGSGLGSHYGSGMGSHYGMSPYGSSSRDIFSGSQYGSPMGSHYGSGFGSGLGSHYGSGFGSGLGSHYGSGFGSGMGSSYGMPQHYRTRSVGGMGGQQAPEVDIYEVGNDYIIELDLPGHSREHIDTKLYGNELVITSKPPRRSHNFHINERSLGYNDVHRKLYLPQDANAQSINASLTNGVLKIQIPRTMTTAASTTSGASTITPGATTGMTGMTGMTGSSNTAPSTTIIKDTVTTTTETKRV